MATDKVTHPFGGKVTRTPMQPREFNGKWSCKMVIKGHFDGVESEEDISIWGTEKDAEHHFRNLTKAFDEGLIVAGTYSINKGYKNIEKFEVGKEVDQTKDKVLNGGRVLDKGDAVSEALRIYDLCFAGLNEAYKGVIDANTQGLIASTIFEKVYDRMVN